MTLSPTSGTREQLEQLLVERVLAKCPSITDKDVAKLFEEGIQYYEEKYTVSCPAEIREKEKTEYVHVMKNAMQDVRISAIRSRVLSRFTTGQLQDLLQEEYEGCLGAIWRRALRLWTSREEIEDLLRVREQFDAAMADLASNGEWKKCIVGVVVACSLKLDDLCQDLKRQAVAETDR